MKDYNEELNLKAIKGECTSPSDLYIELRDVKNILLKFEENLIKDIQQYLINGVENKFR